MVRDLDVRLSTGEVRRGVPSTALRPILRFQPDQHVLHANGFLGRIEEVPWQSLSSSSGAWGMPNPKGSCAATGAVRPSMTPH